MINEDFSAYHDIKKDLIEALRFVNTNDIDSAKKHLSFCFRLLSEAPSRNADLGYETLQKIDAAYKKLSSSIS